jgi:hypothetical protein
VYLVVWSLAIQAPGTIDAYAILVLEVDDLSGGGPLGLVLRELVYDRNNPAVLFHCALVSEVFGGLDDNRGIRIAYVLARHPPASVVLGDAARLFEKTDGWRTSRIPSAGGHIVLGAE